MAWTGHTHACPLCMREHSRPGPLCEDCNADRLAEASAARIAAGTGLTYSNAEAFTEERWIAVMRARLGIN